MSEKEIYEIPKEVILHLQQAMPRFLTRYGDRSYQLFKANTHNLNQRVKNILELFESIDDDYVKNMLEIVFNIEDADQEKISQLKPVCIELAVEGIYKQYPILEE